MSRRPPRIRHDASEPRDGGRGEQRAELDSFGPDASEPRSFRREAHRIYEATCPSVLETNQMANAITTVYKMGAVMPPRLEPASHRNDLGISSPMIAVLPDRMTARASIREAVASVPMNEWILNLTTTTPLPTPNKSAKAIAARIVGSMGQPASTSSHAVRTLVAPMTAATDKSKTPAARGITKLRATIAVMEF